MTRPTDGEPGGVRLVRSHYWGILAVALGAFLFAAGPIWRHPFSIDRSIIISYLLIPGLVALSLAVTRRLNLASLAMETVELVLFKYGITTCVAVALWAVNDPEPRVAPVRPPPPPKSIEPRPKASVLDEVTRVDLPGLAIGNVGRTIVYVSKGLESLVFDPPQAAIQLDNAGRGVRPNPHVARQYQAIRLASTDGQTHAIGGLPIGANDVVLSLPMLAAGRSEPYVPKRALGLVGLRCRVHPDEPRSHLVVLHHPFHQVLNGPSPFEFEGLPRLGPVEISGIDETGQRAHAVISVADRPDIRARLRFGLAKDGGLDDD